MKKQKKRRVKAGYAIVEKHLQAMIRKAIEKAKPKGREICGFILFDGYRLELVRAKNVAKGPGCFELSLRQMRKIKKAARKLNHQVVGTFHSHPVWYAEPGTSDIEGAWNNTLMLVISCLEKDAKLWHICKQKAVRVPLRLIGR